MSEVILEASLISTAVGPERGTCMEIVREGTAIALAGQLDGRCSAEMRDALYDHIEQHPDDDVVVDLSKVESIDVTAVKMLAACAVRLQRAGRQVVLRGCSPAVRRLFAFSGWWRFFLLERTVGQR